MPKLVKLMFIVMSIMSIAVCQANSVSEDGKMNKSVNKEFIKLLDYEIQNRAFALETMKVAVEKSEGAEELPFLKAYLALELLNQQRFSPIAEQYQLDMAPRFWTRTRTQVGLLATALMPKTSLKAIHAATLKYVPVLQKMERLAQQKDKTFFAYVVEQEEVQAAAVGLVLDGKVWLAAKMLNSFVADNQVAEPISGGEKTSTTVSVSR